VEALFDEGIQTETNPVFEGLEVLPSYTKIDKNREIKVTIQNKDSKSPLKIPEGIEMVTVTTVEKRVDHFSLHEYQAAKTIFNQIPRVHKIECYYHRPPLEKTEISIYIEASDPYGQTSTRSYSNPNGPVEPYAPGIRLFRHYETPSPIGGQIALTMLLIPDLTGNYAVINEHDIAKAKETIQNVLGSSGLELLYFFLDPKLGFSIDTRILVTEIYTAFPFTILPVAYHPKHEQCIRPALRKNYPEIFVKPVFKTNIMGAFLVMFRHWQDIVCHFHIPLMDKDSKPITETLKIKLVHFLLTELRYMRVPTNMVISVDGNTAITELKLNKKQTARFLDSVASNLSFILPPNPRCSWPERIRPLKPQIMDHILEGCRCSCCLTNNISGPSGTMLVYEGQINELIQEIPKNRNLFLVRLETLVILVILVI